MMKKMEMTAKEEDPSSQLPVYYTTAHLPRQQAHTHCNIDIDSDSPSQTLLSGRCCLRFPCFGKNRIRLGTAPKTPSSSSSSSFWAHIRTAENGNTWWARPVRVFKKLREWSEVLAGPKWKTFIRRFNRSGCKGVDHYHQGNGSSNSKMFQYDPMSYALNFDEGIMTRIGSTKKILGTILILPQGMSRFLSETVVLVVLVLVKVVVVATTKNRPACWIYEINPVALHRLFEIFYSGPGNHCGVLLRRRGGWDAGAVEMLAETMMGINGEEGFRSTFNGIKFVWVAGHQYIT